MPNQESNAPSPTRGEGLGSEGALRLLVPALDVPDLRGGERATILVAVEEAGRRRNALAVDHAAFGDVVHDGDLQELLEAGLILGRLDLLDHLIVEGVPIRVLVA